MMHNFHFLMLRLTYRDCSGGGGVGAVVLHFIGTGTEATREDNWATNMNRRRGGEIALLA